MSFNKLPPELLIRILEKTAETSLQTTLALSCCNKRLYAIYKPREDRTLMCAAQNQLGYEYEWALAFALMVMKTHEDFRDAKDARGIAGFFAQAYPLSTAEVVEMIESVGRHEVALTPKLARLMLRIHICAQRLYGVGGCPMHHLYLQGFSLFSRHCMGKEHCTPSSCWHSAAKQIGMGTEADPQVPAYIWKNWTRFVVRKLYERDLGSDAIGVSHAAGADGPSNLLFSYTFAEILADSADEVQWIEKAFEDRIRDLSPRPSSIFSVLKTWIPSRYSI